MKSTIDLQTYVKHIESFVEMKGFFQKNELIDIPITITVQVYFLLTSVDSVRFYGLYIFFN